MNFIEPVKDLFITESKELLDRLEQVSLQIESQSDKMETLREMFRCIHSIKGSSGMFGFEAIEFFLHHFENLLDELRNEQLQVSSSVVDIILKSIDHARTLVNKPGLNLTRAEKKLSETLIATMKDVITHGEPVSNPSKQELINISVAANQQKEILTFEEIQPKSFTKEEKSLEGWIVEISVTDEGIKHDFDPTYILKELEELGWKKMIFIPGSIPDIISYDPEKPFGRWLIEYADSVNPDSIEDVFAFVENELKYSITSTEPEINSINSLKTQTDLLEEDEFKETIDPKITKSYVEPTSNFGKPIIQEVAKVAKKRVEFLEEEKENSLPLSQTSYALPQSIDLKDHGFEIESQEHQTTEKKEDNSTEKQSTIRVNVEVLEDLLNLVSELVLNRNQFMQMAQSTSNHQLTKHVNQLNRLTSEIQETAMRTRMQAIGTSWTRFPRIVRDLSIELGKDVELKMEGESTELDRQVIQHISEPMIHLIRNAMDHGIEKREQRIKLGKPGKGHIRLNAYNRGGHIIIEVSDDGKGIDLEIIRKKALDRGLLTKENFEKASAHQLYDFMFHPGFSTAGDVTKISGRGVGLDVVRKNIEDLGGSVEVQSEQGNGSLFKIKIPLTLAIISALIVKTGTHFYAIPEIGIQELVWLNEVNYDKVIHLEGSRVLTLRNKLLPLVNLTTVLGSLEEEEDIRGKHVIVIQNSDLVYGLVVDSVDQIQEIVVKPLNRLLKSIQVYSGTTLIGSEQIVLILDVNGIATQAKLYLEDFNKRSIREVEIEKAEEKTLFLLFHSGKTQKAVHLGMVARLEEMRKEKLEEVDGQFVIQYRDHIMPLIEYRSGTINEKQETIPVIVFQSEQSNFGLIVDSFNDIVEEAVQFEQVSKRAGILGMAVLNGKSTEIIDVNMFFQTIHSTQHKLSLKQKGFVSVLLAERSDFLRGHIKGVLQAAGMQTVAVNSKKEALSQLKKHVFQLVISGLDLADGDGFMLASSIHNDSSIPPTLLLSISSHALDETSQKKLFSAHINGFDKDIILETLQSVLDHNSILL
jgi:two-component system, chemotaxis family, sensor kinase CheA